MSDIRTMLVSYYANKAYKDEWDAAISQALSATPTQDREEFLRAHKPLMDVMPSRREIQSK